LGRSLLPPQGRNPLWSLQSLLGWRSFPRPWLLGCHPSCSPKACHFRFLCRKSVPHIEGSVRRWMGWRSLRRPWLLNCYPSVSPEAWVQLPLPVQKISTPYWRMSKTFWVGWRSFPQPWPLDYHPSCSPMACHFRVLRRKLIPHIGGFVRKQSKPNTTFIISRSGQMRCG
jgi:hypothetical protein